MRRLADTARHSWNSRNERPAMCADRLLARFLPSAWALTMSPCSTRIRELDDDGRSRSGTVKAARCQHAVTGYALLRRIHAVNHKPGDRCIVPLRGPSADALGGGGQHQRRLNPHRAHTAASADIGR